MRYIEVRCEIYLGPLWDMLRSVVRYIIIYTTTLLTVVAITATTGVHYNIAYPFPDFESARGLRMSPIFPRMREHGAVFGQVMGYERPCYFREPHEMGRDEL